MLDEKVNSAEIAMWYKDSPIQADIIKALEGKVTKECRWYLIGKLCLAEKNKRGAGEYIKDVYARVGNGFGYTAPALQRIVVYTKAIEHIQKLFPEIAFNILNGETRLPLPYAVKLSKMTSSEIFGIVERITNEKASAEAVFNSREKINKKHKRRGRPSKNYKDVSRLSVKDTPVYIPDAHVDGLAYTIQSWINMIDRVFTASDFNEVSSSARNRLSNELSKLTSAAETLTVIMSEVE